MANLFCNRCCANVPIRVMPSEAIVYRSSCASFCRSPCEIGPRIPSWLRVAQVQWLYIKSRLLLAGPFMAV